jgi:hypothetical protein
MTTAAMIRAYEKITPTKIRDLGIGAVQLHQQKVVNDLGDANDRGLTFSGDNISDVPKFSDWIESGEFRDKLRFEDTENIDLTSGGDGFDAIRAAYSEADYIAPTAAVLSENTMQKIKADFINNIINEIK